MMDKLENQLSRLNVTADMTQLGTSNVFRADGGHGHHAYFRLSDKFEFDEIKPGKDGAFPPEILAPSYYSFKNMEGKIVVLRNDVETAHLALDGLVEDQKTSFKLLNENAPNIINYGKSAVIFEIGRAEPSCLYIADLERPKLAQIQEIKNIKEGAADYYGKQFFAFTKWSKNADPAERYEDPNEELQNGPPSEDEVRISGANFDVKPPVVAQFKTPVEMKTHIFYCAPAKALVLIDREKIRLLDSNHGEPIAILYHKDLFKGFENPQDQPENSFLKDENGLSIESVRLPKFSILPGVPAAIFGDNLIDLRSGERVDQLFGFTPKSVFAVDHTNKKLYYTTSKASTATGGNSGNLSTNDRALMCINVYDLHEVEFQFQITLGSRSIVEDEAVERNDYIKQLFISQDGKLIALSAPER